MGFLETLGRSGFDPGRAAQQGFSLANQQQKFKDQEIERKKKAEELEKLNTLVDIRNVGLPKATQERFKTNNSGSFGHGNPNLLTQGDLNNILTTAAERADQIKLILGDAGNEAEATANQARQRLDELKAKGAPQDKIQAEQENLKRATDELTRVSTIGLKARTKQQQERISGFQGINAAEQQLEGQLDRSFDQTNLTAEQSAEQDRLIGLSPGVKQDPGLAAASESGDLTRFNQRLRQRETDAAALAKGSKVSPDRPRTLEALAIKQFENGEISFTELQKRAKKSDPTERLFKSTVVDKNTGKKVIVIADKFGNEVGRVGDAPKTRADVRAVSDLRKEFNSRPIVKQFKEIDLKLGQMERALIKAKGSGSKIASDQALITLFNKMTDPDSVVRVSEFARTAESQSFLSSIQGKIEKLGSGGAGLTDPERDALVELAREFKNVAEKKFNDEIDFFSQEAKIGNFSPTRLGPDFKKVDSATGLASRVKQLMKSNSGLSEEQAIEQALDEADQGTQ